MQPSVDHSELIQALSAAFPEHSQSSVRRTLQQEQYDVDAAAEKLLTLQPFKQQLPEQPRRRHTRFTAQPQAPGTKLGWKTLTEQHGAAGKNAEGRTQPEFAFQPKAPAADSEASFPYLPQSRSLPSAPHRSPIEGPGTPDRLPEKAHSRIFSEVAKPAERTLAPTAWMSSQKTADVSQLLKSHPWADAGLVQDLLNEIGQDQTAAVVLLEGMATRPQATAMDAQHWQHNAPDRSQNATPVGSANATPVSSAAATPEGTASDRSMDEATAGSGIDDIYHKHRRSANQLTRKWRKAVHAATLAYAAEDHSGARRLSQQARKLREAALTAHEHAARLIEHEHNTARGLSEGVLDLHGLHASEAVAALDRRMQTRKQHQQGPGTREELQVIVGIGTHSSEGEASLGRVIASHLLGLNIAFRTRGGVIVLDAV